MTQGFQVVKIFPEYQGMVIALSLPDKLYPGFTPDGFQIRKSVPSQVPGWWRPEKLPVL